MNQAYFILLLGLACAPMAYSGKIPSHTKDFDQEILAEGPKCPLEDPLVRPDTTLINATLSPLAVVNLGSFMENFTLTGLSTFKYNISINFLLLTATFDVHVGKLLGTSSNYVADGYIDARPLPAETAPSGNFTGSGSGRFEFENLQFSGRASVWVNLIGDKVTLTNLEISKVGFDKLALNFENYVISDARMDWAEFNSHVKENFDRDWPIHQDALTSKFKDTANTVIGKYTLKELLEFIQEGEDGPNCDGTTTVAYKSI